MITPAMVRSSFFKGMVLKFGLRGDEWLKECILTTGGTLALDDAGIKSGGFFHVVFAFLNKTLY